MGRFGGGAKPDTYAAMESVRKVASIDQEKGLQTTNTVDWAYSEPLLLVQQNVQRRWGLF